MEVVFSYTKYEGGHPLLGNGGGVGNLHVGTGGVGMGTFKIKNMIPMSLVESVEVVGANVAKSKVGAVAVFGVLGLAAKGSKQQTGLIVHTSDGNAAYFTIDKMSEVQVRAKLAPVLTASSKPFTGEAHPTHTEASPTEPVTGPLSPDLVPQLRELAKMRDDGNLTDEEFAAAKTQLLRPAAILGVASEAAPPAAVHFADEGANRLAGLIRYTKTSIPEVEARHLEHIAQNERDRATYSKRAMRRAGTNSEALLASRESLLASDEKLMESTLALRDSLPAKVEKLREDGRLTDDEYAAMKALLVE